MAAHLWGGEPPRRRGGAARLVFERRGNELRHLGRLLSFEPACIDFLTERLLRLPGIGFVVFEDVHVAGGLERRPGRSAFRYQNNWQLPLNGPGEAAAPSRQTAQATARKLRALARERASVRVGFDRNPSEAFLRRVVALNRAKIEAQGRRHGIDEVEFGRLRAISAELGHGAALTEGDALIAGDLICIADNRAYFLTGGYEPDFQRFSPGMITLSHAIEACRRRGILDFNLLWGDGVYKQRLGGRCQPLVTIVSRRSPATLLRPAYLAALSHFGWLHLKRALKPMLARLKGLAPEKPGPRVALHACPCRGRCNHWRGLRIGARMPRFYFDATLQGEPEADPEGIELASRAIARQEGVRAAAEMVKDRHHGENAKDVTLAIREGEEPVATIRLSLTIEEPSR